MVLRRKKKGQKFTADHLNELTADANRIDRPGVNLPGVVAGSVRSSSPIAPHVMSIVKITNRQYLRKNTYGCKLRHFNQGDDWKEGGWRTSDKQWRLDGFDMNQRFDADDYPFASLGYDPNDRVTAYWDEQRGAFVPTWRCEPTSMVDFEFEPIVVGSMEQADEDFVSFALVERPPGASAYTIVNNRRCDVNAKRVQTVYGSYLRTSGWMHYTFSVQAAHPTPHRLRVAVGHCIPKTKLLAAYASGSLRLNSKGLGGVDHSSDDSFPFGSYMRLRMPYAEEAFVRNPDDTVRLNPTTYANKSPIVYDRHEATSSTIGVITPVDEGEASTLVESQQNENRERWTMEADLYVDFSIRTRP